MSRLSRNHLNVLDNPLRSEANPLQLRSTCLPTQRTEHNTNESQGFDPLPEITHPLHRATKHLHAEEDYRTLAKDSINLPILRSYHSLHTLRLEIDFLYVGLLGPRRLRLPSLPFDSVTRPVGLALTFSTWSCSYVPGPLQSLTLCKILNSKSRCFEVVLAIEGQLKVRLGYNSVSAVSLPFIRSSF